MNIKKICVLIMLSSVLIMLSMLSYIDVYSLFVSYGILFIFGNKKPDKYDLWLLIPIAIGLLHKLAII